MRLSGILLLAIVLPVVGLIVAGFVMILVLGLTAIMYVLAALAVYLLMTFVFVVCVERPLARRRARQPVVAMVERIRRAQTANASTSGHAELLPVHEVSRSESRVNYCMGQDSAPAAVSEKTRAVT